MLSLNVNFVIYHWNKLPYDEVCYQRLEDDNSNNQEELISLSMVSDSDGIFESNNNINST